MLHYNFYITKPKGISVRKTDLENSLKKIGVLIGLKSCFYRPISVIPNLEDKTMVILSPERNKPFKCKLAILLLVLQIGN